MSDLNLLQASLIAIIFIWSGFVRSGLGFGGALFTLPFLLLVVNDPLIFLPIISIHLLLFASFTIGREQWFIFKNKTAPTTVPSKVNWWFVRYSIMIMFVPKIIGVIGLLILPVEIMNIVIFALIGAYALTYIANKPMRSNSRIMDIIFLAIGAYISGISLLGGPLIIAVALRYIKPYEYRSTLFVLWFFLVAIKMTAFAAADVDLQLWNALLLLPFAGLGHYLGLRAHQFLLDRDSRSFYRSIGWILFLTSCGGISQLLYN